MHISASLQQDGCRLLAAMECTERESIHTKVV
jgi:hypothetical protein